MAPPQQFGLFTLSEKRSSCVAVFCLLGNKRQRVHLYLLAPNKLILLTSWAIATSLQVLALCPFITCCQWCLGYNVYARLVFRGPTCCHRHLFYAVGMLWKTMLSNAYMYIVMCTEWTVNPWSFQTGYSHICTEGQIHLVSINRGNL